MGLLAGILFATLVHSMHKVKPNIITKNAVYINYGAVSTVTLFNIFVNKRLDLV